MIETNPGGVPRRKTACAANRQRSSLTARCGRAKGQTFALPMRLLLPRSSHDEGRP